MSNHGPGIESSRSSIRAHACGECSRWKHPEVTRTLIETGIPTLPVAWLNSNACIRLRNCDSQAGAYADPVLYFASEARHRTPCIHVQGARELLASTETIG